MERGRGGCCHIASGTIWDLTVSSGRMAMAVGVLTALCSSSEGLPRPLCPRHPGATAGTRVSTLKQEVSDKSRLLRGTQDLAPPFERDLVPVTGHFFPSISEAGLPRGRASLAAGSSAASSLSRAARDEDVQEHLLLPCFSFMWAGKMCS